MSGKPGRAVAQASLVLGSASPRRRELLEMQSIRLQVRSPSVDETARPNEAPTVYLERIVSAKLEAVARDLEPGVHAFGIVVADTVVTIGAEILGKPRDRDDSLHMLQRLSGITHEVLTRFAIGALDGKLLHAETVTTKVTFRTLTDLEQTHYVATGEGDDKAGAYAVQGRGAAFVSKIDGSYANVVGLPICELMVALARLGFAA